MSGFTGTSASSSSSSSILPALQQQYQQQNQQQQQIKHHLQPIHNRYYAGNVQLMEARVVELSTTVRALYRSIEELQHAIDHDSNNDDNDGDNRNNDNDNVGPDPVFVDAIAENCDLIERHQKELFELVQSMQDLGASSAEVPDDVRVIHIPTIRQQLQQYQTEYQTHPNDDQGLYL